MFEPSELPQSRETFLSQLEEEVQITGRIAIDSQLELRLLLREREKLTETQRHRIDGLLNPRHAGQIELTDEQLRTAFRRTTDDNYTMSSVDYRDRMAEYDAAHGYYVTLQTDLID